MQNELQKHPWRITSSHFRYFCCVRMITKAKQSFFPFLVLEKRSDTYLWLWSGCQTDLVFIYKTINICQLLSLLGNFSRLSYQRRRAQFLIENDSILPPHITADKHYINFISFFVWYHLNEFYTLLMLRNKFTMLFVSSELFKKWAKKTTKNDRFWTELTMHKKRYERPPHERIHLMLSKALRFHHTATYRQWVCCSYAKTKIEFHQTTA